MLAKKSCTFNGLKIVPALAQWKIVTKVIIVVFVGKGSKEPDQEEPLESMLALTLQQKFTQNLESVWQMTTNAYTQHLCVTRVMML